MEPIQRGYTAVAVLKYQLEAASGTVALIQIATGNARTESIIPNGVDSDRLCHVPIVPLQTLIVRNATGGDIINPALCVHS